MTRIPRGRRVGGLGPENNPGWVARVSSARGDGGAIVAGVGHSRRGKTASIAPWPPSGPRKTRERPRVCSGGRSWRAWRATSAAPFPLSALSPSLCHPPACRREGSLGRFAEPAARGFRSLGAVRTPLDVATRGIHATMRLGRYACSAPCDRAPGGFYWLVHQDDLIGAVRHQQRSGELWGAERTGALTRSLARPVPPEHARTP